MSKVHLIGNAHLDIVWLWRWQEGLSEILSTFRSALDRMKEFPNYKFTCAGAVYYQWIEKIDPDMLAEIRHYADQGRWCIAGGWFLQPDCNIPCGESYARHALISQRYFKEKFGVAVTAGYNVDSFGHNAALPQILKKSGINSYTFMRPFPKEQGRNENVFLWESADGTQIPAYRIPMYYNIDAEKIDKLYEIKDISCRDNIDMMAFYGVGNHGGGPTVKLLSEIEKLISDDFIYSTPDEYFKCIDKSKLPVIAGELQHHARGCYSAMTFVKSQNRKCENNLLAAEKLCSMAGYLTGYKYPKQKLNKGWKNLMFNQFHDILAGCAVKKAYDDAGYLFGETMSVTEQEITGAIMSIAHNIDTLNGKRLTTYKDGTIKHWHIWEAEGIGMPFVVFNPHTWRVKMPIDISFKATGIKDYKGNAIPFQAVRGDQTNDWMDKWHTVFMADIEPLGYAVYRIFVEEEGKNNFAPDTSVGVNFLENSIIRVEFSEKTGDICSIYDKKNGRFILKGESKAVLLDETECDTWAHWKDSLGAVAGMFEKPEFTVIENGNVRSVLRVTAAFNSSVLRRDYCLESGSDAVKVTARVDFHEKHKSFKLSFPTDGDSVISEIPYSTVIRKKNSGEEPCGAWISNGIFCVANDGKYGYDAVDGEMRLTVLRGAVYADHVGVRDEFCEYMDQGEHDFTYWIYPFTDNRSAEERAQELNFGLRGVLGGFHGGKLPEHGSCFSKKEDSVIITAIKKAEDNDETVIRFYEADGIDSSVSFTVFGKTVETDIGHNEIKTFNTAGKELNLIEW